MRGQSNKARRLMRWINRILVTGHDTIDARIKDEEDPGLEDLIEELGDPDGVVHPLVFLTSSTHVWPITYEGDRYELRLTKKR